MNELAQTNQPRMTRLSEVGRPILGVAWPFQTSARFDGLAATEREREEYAFS